MGKWEQKIGRFAIPHLTLVLLCINAVGYLMMLFNQTEVLYLYCTLNPGQVLSGQIWRLFTWLFIPYRRDIFSFLLISILFYLPIGTQMERVWGDFRYNLYIFSGLFFTILGVFGLYLYFYVAAGGEMATAFMMLLSIGISPYYVMLSIFFAFAVTYPDNMAMFMFLIPIKMKWLGLAYGAYMIYLIIEGDIAQRIIIIMSLLNFALFYLTSNGTQLRQNVKTRRRQETYEKNLRMRPEVRTTHACATCGATSETHPDYEFRYCSKCNGAYEYCQEHLFTHVHVT